MNDQELQQIEERVNKATNAPWIVEADEYSGRNWLIGCVSVFLGGSAWSDKSYYVTTKGVHASELEGDAKTDAEFIAAARTDVPALVAEVRRLTAERDEWKAKAKYWRDRHEYDSPDAYNARINAALRNMAAGAGS